jgi:hypothetical protein
VHRLLYTIARIPSGARGGSPGVRVF